MLLLVVLVLTTTLHSDADVNGSLETIGDIRVLNLWGSWTEIGYAHGYLLGPDVKELFETYFLEFAGGIGNVNLAREFIDQYFEIPDEFRTYAAGMVDGVADTIGTWSDVYGRDLDTLDLYLASSVPDVSHLIDCAFPPLCSSIAAWGDATLSDPVLGGGLGIGRNLDYWVDSALVFYDHQLLITYDPAGGQEWVSVGVAGFMGALSGMSVSGTNGTINMGNHQGTYQTSSPFVPICMALALGLSDDDFDGSGTDDIDDLVDAVSCWNRSNSYDVHCTGEPGPGYPGEPALVVEISNERGYQIRQASDDPDISPDMMILTNHHRVLYPPVYCDRYSRLIDSLTTNPDVTLDRLWDLVGCVGYPTIPGVGATIQSMIFIPSDTTIAISFSTESEASWEKEPEWIAWSDIFPNHDPEGIEEGEASPLLEIEFYPNPSTGLICLIAGCDMESIAVYDLQGRRCEVQVSSPTEGGYSLDLCELPTGVYSVVVSYANTAVCERVVIAR
jgi:hypothetical protein